MRLMHQIIYLSIKVKYVRLGIPSATDFFHVNAAIIRLDKQPIRLPNYFLGTITTEHARTTITNTGK